MGVFRVLAAHGRIVGGTTCALHHPTPGGWRHAKILTFAQRTKMLISSTGGKTRHIWVFLGF